MRKRSTEAECSESWKAGERGQRGWEGRERERQGGGRKKGNVMSNISGVKQSGISSLCSTMPGEVSGPASLSEDSFYRL